MERKTGKVLTVVGSIMALLVFVGTALAQNNPADNMQILVEKMKADKKLLVAENMQLTEAEAKGFWPVYESTSLNCSSFAPARQNSLRTMLQHMTR
jgi:hypothetical protein